MKTSSLKFRYFSLAFLSLVSKGREINKTQFLCGRDTAAPTQKLGCIYLSFCPKFREDGFTIIEALVVVIVLSILSTMALPSMLAFSNRARESEARTYVSSINKGQQIYYLQHTSFGNLANLAIGISPNTRHYTYASMEDNVNWIANTTATPTGTMRGFAGKVWVGAIANEATLHSILCEGPSGLPPAIPGNTCP